MSDRMVHVVTNFRVLMYSYMVMNTELGGVMNKYIVNCYVVTF